MMMRSGALIDETERKKMVTSVKNLSASANAIIAQGKVDLAMSGVQDFVSHKLGKFFQLVHGYRNTFKVLSVKDRKTMEEVLSCIFVHKEVREAFDELLDSEREWDDFMRGIDKIMSTRGGAPLKVGDRGPLDYNVVSAMSEMKEFDAAGVSILFVSFGERKGAVKWIKETKCPFEVVLDEDRKIYHSFGLYRWVSKVWNVATMTYYAEQLAAGRNLPKPYQQVSDDPIQMGGDFMLDSKGTVVFTYASQMSSDRPSVDVLLSAARSSSIPSIESK